MLYDGLKNLALIPLLIWIGRRRPIAGARSAHFVFWYAFLRLFVDLLRDYPSHRLALGTGQTLNIVMAALGMVLVGRAEWRWRRNRGVTRQPPVVGAAPAGALAHKRVAFLLVLVFSLAIPGNWTQDVPARYGKRHAGLQHSRLYPAIDTAAPPRHGATAGSPPTR